MYLLRARMHVWVYLCVNKVLMRCWCCASSCQQFVAFAIYAKIRKFWTKDVHTYFIVFNCCEFRLLTNSLQKVKATFFFLYCIVFALADVDAVWMNYIQMHMYIYEVQSLPYKATVIAINSIKLILLFFLDSSSSNAWDVTWNFGVAAVTDFPTLAIDIGKTTTAAIM